MTVMNKLPVLSGKEIIRRFEKLGYEIVRQKGSHVRMINISDKLKAPITVPLHQTVGRGLLRKILKQAEISVNEFNGVA